MNVTRGQTTIDAIEPMVVCNLLKQKPMCHRYIRNEFSTCVEWWPSMVRYDSCTKPEFWWFSTERKNSITSFLISMATRVLNEWTCWLLTMKSAFCRWLVIIDYITIQWKWRFSTQHFGFKFNSWVCEIFLFCYFSTYGVPHTMWSWVFFTWFFITLYSSIETKCFFGQMEWTINFSEKQ